MIRPREPLPPPYSPATRREAVIVVEDTDAIRRFIEIAVVDALGLENSVARSRTLIAGALAAAKLLEADELASFSLDIDEED